MAIKLSELKKLSEAELDQKYDEEAKNVQPSLNYFWYEIVRREQNRQTNWIIGLTIVMTVAAVIASVGVFTS